MHRLDSGHGGQTRTKDSDEPDGKDEGEFSAQSKSVRRTKSKILTKEFTRPILLDIKVPKRC